MVDPVRTPTVARVRLSNPDVAARKAMWDRCWPCRPTPGSVVCKPSILHLSLEGYVGLWVFGRRCPARRYKPSVEGSQQVGMRSRLLEFSRRQYPTRVGPSRRHWNRRTQSRRAGVRSARSCSSNPCPGWAAPVSARPASWGCRHALGHAYLRKCWSLNSAMRQVIGRELARFAAAMKKPGPTVIRPSPSCCPSSLAAGESSTC
jgi:hypothetical protein